MGSVTLPSSGLVYMDTQVVIYSVETHATYWPLLQPVWQAARAGQFHLISSELALMEALVGPLRSRDTILQTAYEQVFQSAELSLVAIALPILREAARLRATIPALRTPDALHAATALLSGSVLFLTNDTGFRRIPGLSLTVLRDLLVP